MSSRASDILWTTIAFTRMRGTAQFRVRSDVMEFRLRVQELRVNGA
jgi:hypothetical protein